MFVLTANVDGPCNLNFSIIICIKCHIRLDGLFRHVEIKFSLFDSVISLFLILADKSFIFTINLHHRPVQKSHLLSY